MKKVQRHLCCLKCWLNANMMIVAKDATASSRQRDGWMCNHLRRSTSVIVTIYHAPIIPHYAPTTLRGTTKTNSAATNSDQRAPTDRASIRTILQASCAQSRRCMRSNGLLSSIKFRWVFARDLHIVHFSFFWLFFLFSLQVQMFASVYKQCR